MDFSWLVRSLLADDTLTLKALKDQQRFFAKEHKMDTLPSKSQILAAYFAMVDAGEIERNEQFESLLRKRAIRSLSGIVPIQVLTKPFPCPARCIFCPNEPEMPKSYIKSEPGAMRALLNHFDPKKQVYNRLHSLRQTGHKIDKIEMIVLGGTWDFYLKDYKEEFIKGLYDACNSFDQLETVHDGTREDWKYAFQIANEADIKYADTWQEAVAQNQHAKHRIIGLTIETRPEFATDENCRAWRDFGVTRIEMGLQSTNDEVLDLNKRGHRMAEVRAAMHKMRQYGFKFSIHIMPGLYGSTVEKDIQTFADVYTDPTLKPDEIKFYPTSVIANTELYRLYQEGEYQAITRADIEQIIRKTFREIIPPYTRIKRLIRDIPATEIVAGSNITNLSQLMHEQLLQEYQKADPDFLATFYERLYPSLQVFSDEQEFFVALGEGDFADRSYLLGKTPDLLRYRNFVSLDTRSREMRNNLETTEGLSLVVRTYLSSVGRELFVSYEDELGYLYGFTRLLLPHAGEEVDIEGLGKKVAIIRELHVYGSLQSLAKDDFSGSGVQHTGLGKKLLAFAERFSKESGYHALSVISWVGVREYYQKQGYSLKGTYMVKEL